MDSFPGGWIVWALFAAGFLGSIVRDLMQAGRG